MFNMAMDIGADLNCGFSQIILYNKFSEHEDVLEYLAQKGVDLNYIFSDNNDGKKYLTKHIIYKKADNKVKAAKLKLLVNNVPDITSVDDNGDTALLRHLNDSMVLALIPDEGVRSTGEIITYLSAKNKDGKTACDLEQEKSQPRQKVLDRICVGRKIANEIGKHIENNFSNKN